MKTRADDGQKRCELRQGLLDRGYVKNADRGLRMEVPREGQQRLQAQFERATHCCEIYQHKKNGA